MHELALAQSVIQILCEEARRHDLHKVERARIQVGVLRAVVPEFLVTCMKAVSQGTMAEGMEVDLEEVKAAARCPDCALEYEISEYLFVCPGCGRVGGEVIAGEELALIELEGD